MTDELLGSARVDRLIEALEAARTARPFTETRRVAAELPQLSLSDRSRALAGALLIDVPGAHGEFVAVVREALQDPGFGTAADGWILWPVGLATAGRAVEDGSQEAFDAGMAMLRELTPRFTSEFSVRPMLRHDLPRALAHMESWVDDPDWNVRRLATEGSRPLLPWGERLPALVADPAKTRRILDALHTDPSDSVRRSVANHLNDHSRAHADYTVEVAGAWLAAAGPHAERTVRHALRTLVKRGDLGALGLLGFDAAALDGLVVPALTLSPERVPGAGSVRFAAEIANTADRTAELMIDYVLFFPDARGAERVKVFKLGRRSLAPGERTEIAASHSFRPITTRRYYPGRYGVALQINGVVQDRADFELAPADPA